MTRLYDFKRLFLYGSALAILVFALKWLQWKFLIVDHATDVYVGLVAVFFTTMGVWIASQLLKSRVKTMVIEKEVPRKFCLNETELKKLNLNSREFEVLKLIALGYSNASIADSLYLSLSTIKTHVSNLFAKLEVKSRTQAIEKAKRLGIIQ